MPNFEDILNRSVDDIKPPPAFPEGTYLTVVQGLPEQLEGDKKRPPGLRFKLQIVQPLEDVDPDELAAFEGGVSGRPINHDILIWDGDTNTFQFNLKRFLEHCGQLADGASLAACIDNTPNSSVLINIKHQMAEGSDRKYARISRTAPAE